MNIFDQLLADNQIPKFVRVRHEMDRGHIDDIEGAVAQAMQREGTLDRIKPGDSVCITAGSRDVANIARVIRAICDQVKSVGAHPFIIPAMGSHAGAKAEGQRGIIEGYGVTEEAMGAPIRATMDTEVIAHSKSGLEIHLDKYANAADFLIPVGRIKAHTDFRGEVESGICKMLVIGMGGQHQQVGVRQRRLPLLYPVGEFPRAEGIDITAPASLRQGQFGPGHRGFQREILMQEAVFPA